MILRNKKKKHTQKEGLKKQKASEQEDFFCFWQASPTTGGAYWAISSVVERAPDNCVVVPGL